MLKSVLSLQMSEAKCPNNIKNSCKESMVCGLINSLVSPNPASTNGLMQWVITSQKDSQLFTSTVNSKELSDTGKKTSSSKPTKKLQKHSILIALKETLTQPMIPINSRAQCSQKKISNLKMKVISPKKTLMMLPMLDSLKMFIFSSWYLTFYFSPYKLPLVFGKSRKGFEKVD